MENDTGKSSGPLYLVADSADGGCESYDTIETPAWWLTTCEWLSRVWHWFHRLVWCRRGKHVWVYSGTSAVLEDKLYSATIVLYECEHCDVCGWSVLDVPVTRVSLHATYDDAMVVGRYINMKDVCIAQIRGAHL